jgi:hypothetical protein
MTNYTPLPRLGASMPPLGARADPGSMLRARPLGWGHVFPLSRTQTAWRQRPHRRPGQTRLEMFAALPPRSRSIPCPTPDCLGRFSTTDALRSHTRREHSGLTREQVCWRPLSTDAAARRAAALRAQRSVLPKIVGALRCADVRSPRLDCVCLGLEQLTVSSQFVPGQWLVLRSIGGASPDSAVLEGRHGDVLARIAHTPHGALAAVARVAHVQRLPFGAHDIAFSELVIFPAPITCNIVGAAVDASTWLVPPPFSAQVKAQAARLGLRGQSQIENGDLLAFATLVDHIWRAYRDQSSD